MTTVDASQRLALLLRTQMAAFKAPTQGRRSRMTGSQAPNQAPDLAAVVAQRIQALSPDDPDRKRKALRIFLESLLLQQLGGSLLHDASFTDMVDSVQRQMEADREIAEAAAALSDLLLSGVTAR